jgi:hypothetical protein
MNDKQTLSNTTKTTFIVTIDSIIHTYSSNMVERLKSFLQDEAMDDFAEVLASFNKYFSGMRGARRGGSALAIRELFGHGHTFDLLDKKTMEELELAKKNDEPWELLVTDNDGSEIVCLGPKHINW